MVHEYIGIDTCFDMNPKRWRQWFFNDLLPHMICFSDPQPSSMCHLSRTKQVRRKPHEVWEVVPMASWISNRVTTWYGRACVLRSNPFYGNGDQHHGLPCSHRVQGLDQHPMILPIQITANANIITRFPDTFPECNKEIPSKEIYPICFPVRIS